jgi:hypothetical protein
LSAPYRPSSWIAGLNIVLRRSFGLDAVVALTAVSKTADSSALLRRQTRELFLWSVARRDSGGHRILSRHGYSFSTVYPPPTVVASFLHETEVVAPRARISAGDVAMVHWGLLPADTSDAHLPRKTPIVAAGRHDAGAERLIVVIGEKLTTAPEVSKTVLALAARTLHSSPRRPVAAEFSRSPIQSVLPIGSTFVWRSVATEMVPLF